MDFVDQVEKAKELCQIALEQEGIWRAKVIKASDIVVDRRVRFQCSQSGCREYGKNFMCPPNTFSVDEFEEVLSEYFMALLVQLKGNIHNEKDWQPEADRWALKLHDIIYRLEKKTFSLGFPFAAGLIGGHCKLCDVCLAGKGDGQKCLHREKARPSMEALGVDVLTTCNNAGLPVDFTPGQVLWTGLVLIN